MKLVNPLKFSKTKQDNHELEKNIFGKYKINKKDSTSWMLISIGMVGLILSIVYFTNADTQWDRVADYRWKKFLSEIIRWTDTPMEDFKGMLNDMKYTIYIAVALTISTMLVSLPIAVFGAKNLFKGPLASIIKTLSAIIRSIPTMIWMFMFIPIFGMDIKTAYIAMTFHGIAFFVKVFSETFEEVEPGITEALMATGANKMKIAYAAILPASFKKIVGWVLLRLEINVAIVVIIAPSVGIPNSIGYTLSLAFGSQNYGQLGLIFFIIIVTMLTIERLSKWILKKL